jgi:hypothetical protein
MAAYGLQQVGVALDGMKRGFPLEGWATIALVVFGALLVISAVILYVGMPGALASAIGSLLALQALALHNAVHLSSTPGELRPHFMRGLVAAALVVLAWAGERRSIIKR